MIWGDRKALIKFFTSGNREVVKEIINGIDTVAGRLHKRR